MTEESVRFKREILGVSILLLLGSLFVIYPFLDAIILAVATSYFLRFGHNRLNRKLDNEFLSSIIVILSVIGFFTLGLYLFINNFNEILGSVSLVSINIQQNIEQLIQTFNLPDTFRAEVLEFLVGFSEAIRGWLRGTLASIPSLLIDFGIYLVTSIYFYKEGGVLKEKVFSLVESFPENEEKIIKSLLRSTDSIFRGVFLTQFLVALTLAVITWIGFKLIGAATTPIPFTELWAILVGIAALLPLVAAFMFYGPVGFYYLAFGQPLKGLLILVFGVLVLNVMTEIFLRPFIGSKQMNEHPLIIFLGFLAGPLTLGLKGLIIGPLLLILSKEFLLNYSELVSDGGDVTHTEDTED